MWICTISLMPDMFNAMSHGVTGRAIKQQHISLHHLDLRTFGLPPHQQVDDTPYGGGPGMVLMAEPLHQAIKAAKAMAPTKAKVIYLSPQGLPWDQHQARIMSQQNNQAFILIAGRYEGIDQRIIDEHVDQEISIGNYILSGGELAAMTILDSVIRLIPGTLGNQKSAQEDSFSKNQLLDYSHYTKPAMWNNHEVPSILLSGNHQSIAQWRHQQQLKNTHNWHQACSHYQNQFRTGENQ